MKVRGVQRGIWRGSAGGERGSWEKGRIKGTEGSNGINQKIRGGPVSPTSMTRDNVRGEMVYVDIQTI